MYIQLNYYSNVVVLLACTIEKNQQGSEVTGKEEYRIFRWLLLTVYLYSSEQGMPSLKILQLKSATQQAMLHVLLPGSKILMLSSCN